MKRLMILGSALWLLPVAASASGVDVDVRVHGGTGWDETTIVEFRANRTGYVALYAAYSDGTIAPVFPVGSWESHRVRGKRTYSVAVEMPCGVRIESVQAVASRRWFDPNECWVAAAPGHGWGQPAWVVTTVSHVPLRSFSFHLGWHGPTHRWTVVRTWSGQPRQQARQTHPTRWRGSDRKWKSTHGDRTPYVDNGNEKKKYQVEGKRKHDDSGRDGAAPPSRWVSGGSAKKKIKATPGTKSSSRNG